MEEPTRINPDDSATPAANVAAVVTIAAISSVRNVLTDLHWSYNGTPTGGEITIIETRSDASTAELYRMKITSGGPGVLVFTPHRACSKGAAVTVTLTAGGAGITGTLHVGHRLV